MRTGVRKGECKAAEGVTHVLINGKPRRAWDRTLPLLLEVLAGVV